MGVVRHPRQPAVAILEGMDGEEDGGEHPDPQQRMQGLLPLRLGEPRDEFLHGARGVERGGGLEDDADFLSLRVEGGDGVRLGLVAAAAPLVLGAVAEQVAVQLAGHVFGDRDLLEGIENLIHDVGVACDLLFIAGRELRDAQTPE